MPLTIEQVRTPALCPDPTSPINDPINYPVNRKLKNLTVTVTQNGITTSSPVVNCDKFSTPLFSYLAPAVIQLRKNDDVAFGLTDEVNIGDCAIITNHILTIAPLLYPNPT